MSRGHFSQKLPSPAILIAVVALFAAIVNPAAAVKKLIGSSDLKNGAVTTAKVRDKAITSAKLANGAVTKDKLAQDALQAGPQGPQGLQGAKGDKGDQGVPGPAGSDAFGQVNEVEGTPVMINNASQQTAEATCPAGQVAVGGGFASDIAASGLSTLKDRRKSGNSAVWQVGIWNATGGNVNITPIAYCVIP